MVGHDCTTACVKGLEKTFGVTLPEFGKYLTLVVIARVGNVKKARKIAKQL
jgi:hypothetical protein